jgi:hypothetical protein
MISFSMHHKGDEETIIYTYDAKFDVNTLFIRKVLFIFDGERKYIIEK